MRSKKELFEDLVVSALQGVLEAKYGVVGEIDPTIAAREAVRIAKATLRAIMETEEEEGF